ncbi:glycosyltransferase family 4 protein [Patescibacteria group bacterium]|nr:glycosyltransferase family 4 protein [Patescibacteria group bacterium]MBU2472955.1 glycosyltransferase family 4 protein [Patescibacteria group bacterium]
MRLLMITRKVDQKDASPAGFTYTWVKKIGEKLEKLYVITWQESDRGDLPDNIEIISLSGSKWLKIFSIQGKLWKILSKVDGVFCHQNPEYTILSAPLTKLFRKKIVSWHTHGTVNWKLKLVNLLTDKILTASEKSCRLKNRKKIEVTGHGIDIEYFKPVILSVSEGSLTNVRKYFRIRERSFGLRPQDDIFRIVSVGRISPTKDLETLIKAISVLKNKGITDLEVQIIGGPVLKIDKKYFKALKEINRKEKMENQIKFLGLISHNQILPYLQNCDLFINLSQTGSVDKAILEAMACEVMVLTSNEAFYSIIGSSLIVKGNNPEHLAEKIKWVMDISREKRKQIGQYLRQEVVENHNLDNLVVKIINQFSLKSS